MTLSKPLNWPRARTHQSRPLGQFDWTSASSPQAAQKWTSGNRRDGPEADIGNGSLDHVIGAS